MQRQIQLRRLNQKRLKEALCLLKLFNLYVIIEECCRSKNYYCTVDGPAYKHGKQGIGKFIFQLFFMIVSSARFHWRLCIIRMKEKIMRHNNSAENTHQ